VIRITALPLLTSIPFSKGLLPVTPPRTTNSCLTLGGTAEGWASPTQLPEAE
jgi:hypothetical protein